MLPEQTPNPQPMPETLVAAQPVAGVRRSSGWVWAFVWVGSILCLCVVVIGGGVLAFRSLPVEMQNPLEAYGPPAVPPEDWTNVFSDPFVSNQNEWAEDDGSRFGGQIERKVDQFVYHWRLSNDTDQMWFSFPGVEYDLSDVYITVETEVVSQGEGGMVYGVIFHYANPDNFYLLSASPAGYWQLDARIADEWYSLIDRRYPSVLMSGDPIKLGVLVHGERIAVLINDEYQGQAFDDSVPSGISGVMAGADQGQSMIIDFDDYEVYAP